MEAWWASRRSALPHGGHDVMLLASEKGAPQRLAVRAFTHGQCAVGKASAQCGRIPSRLPGQRGVDVDCWPGVDLRALGLHDARVLWRVVCLERVGTSCPGKNEPCGEVLIVHSDCTRRGP